MTEVDYQCLRKGTTRMPQKNLKQLLQTAGQHLGVLRGSVCLPPATRSLLTHADALRDITMFNLENFKQTDQY